MTWALAHNGGLSQMGLNGPYGDCLCLDFLKHGGPLLNYVNNSKGVDPLDLDVNGCATSINNGGVQLQFYIPDNALLSWAARYVATWTGAGTVSIVGGTINSSVTGRIEFTPTQNLITFRMTATPVSNPKVFYKPYEALVNAGQIWDPQFLSTLQTTKPGVLRFMDLQVSNGTSSQTNVSVWADRKPLTYITWATDELRPSLRYNGVVTYALNGSSNDYSINLGAALPTDKQKLTILIPTSATNGTCTFSIDNGVTKYQMLRPFADALTSSARWPLSTRFGTFIFDTELQGWLKWGGDGTSFDTYLQNGVPYEAMLDLAATVGAHMHLTVPYLAYDSPSDFVGGLSAYFRDNAPSWMKLRLEGPNEQWATTSVHFAYSSAKQLIRNGGALPGGTTVSFTAAAFSSTGSGATGTSNITIGANTIPVGSTIAVAAFGGIFGFNGNVANVTANTGTVITINRAPSGGSWTSGGTVAPTAQDIHNYYGTGLSKTGQTLGGVLAAPRYDLLCGVQTGSGTASANERLASTYYVLNSGSTANAAKNYATAVCPASYIRPTEWNTNQEIADAYNYSVGNAAQQAALAASYCATLLTAGGGFAIPDVAVFYSGWKTWAISFGVMKLTNYEGGYSPDFTGGSTDCNGAITVATKDASGCVLTIPNVINNGTSNSVSTTTPFVKGQSIVPTAVAGMTQLNGNTYTITGVGVIDGLSANQIRLNVDSSGFSVYTSGGTATILGSRVQVNILRNAAKYAPKLAAYTRTNYNNFAALTDLTFTTEFCSQFTYSQSSKKLDQTGNIGDNNGGIWGLFDPNSYGLKSPAYDGINLYNNKKRRMFVNT